MYDMDLNSAHAWDSAEQLQMRRDMAHRSMMMAGAGGLADLPAGARRDAAAGRAAVNQMALEEGAAEGAGRARGRGQGPARGHGARSSAVLANQQAQMHASAAYGRGRMPAGLSAVPGMDAVMQGDKPPGAGVGAGGGSAAHSGMPRQRGTAAASQPQPADRSRKAQGVHDGAGSGPGGAGAAGGRTAGGGAGPESREGATGGGEGGRGRGGSAGGGGALRPDHGAKGGKGSQGAASRDAPPKSSANAKVSTYKSTVA